MTLAEMPERGDMEPEETTSSSQTGLPVEEWGHQPTYKTFDPKLLLSKRNAGTKMEQRLNERLSIDQPNLGFIPRKGTSPYNITDSMLCLQIDTWHGCPLSGSTSS